LKLTGFEGILIKVTEIKLGKWSMRMRSSRRFLKGFFTHEKFFAKKSKFVDLTPDEKNNDWWKERSKTSEFGQKS